MSFKEDPEVSAVRFLESRMHAHEFEDAFQAYSGRTYPQIQACTINPTPLPRDERTIGRKRAKYIDTVCILQRFQILLDPAATVLASPP